MALQSSSRLCRDNDRVPWHTTVSPAGRPWRSWCISPSTPASPVRSTASAPRGPPSPRSMCAPRAERPREERGLAVGQLDGKVAIVTGGTSGMGERMAEVFVAEDARVPGIGRLDAEGRALAARYSACTAPTSPGRPAPRQWSSPRYRGSGAPTAWSTTREAAGPW
jgi:hypothetical protein